MGFVITSKFVSFVYGGDGDEYDDVESYDGNAPNADDGTMLECLSFGLPGNKSVRSLRFHFYNFSPMHPNRIHLNRLLIQQRNFHKLTFSACDFGSGISYLLEGLANQTELEMFCIDTDDYEKKLGDKDLAAVIDVLREKGPSKSLRILNLYDCGLGETSLNALTALLTKTNCQLDCLCLGEGHDTCFVVTPTYVENF